METLTKDIFLHNDLLIQDHMSIILQHQWGINLTLNLDTIHQNFIIHMIHVEIFEDPMNSMKILLNTTITNEIIMSHHHSLIQDTIKNFLILAESLIQPTMETMIQHEEEINDMIGDMIQMGAVEDL